LDAGWFGDEAVPCLIDAVEDGVDAALLSQGFDAVGLKPINPAGLIRTVAQAVEAGGGATAAAAAA